MLEPPSIELVRQLTDLQLCQPSDLRRARGRVRRLAFDLPAFDSVWIDALVQLRLLTPYQAKQLESGHADQLRIGSFVIIDELGRSNRGTTLLARRLHRRDRCVVKRQRIAADRVSEVTRQMQIVVERANGFAHPQLVLPNEILPSTENELVTVSRLVPGLPLNELLVRRGRFPAPIVFEIGRQLLDGLAALHSRSLIHGDIRMSNVRLTDTGLAVLVDGGLRPVIHPQITIHDTLALEAYDGLATELIGTENAASASSELYAVGCLLWQLLAGRPPFITADPLAKIAAHQTQRIEDIRVLAPDTPPLLADMILQMTSPDPQQRPRSFEEVLQRWGRPGSFSRSRLRQFRRLFDGAVPHFAGPITRNRLGTWVSLATVLLMVSGGLAVLYENGLRTELLAIVQNVRTGVGKIRDRAPSAATIEDPAPMTAVSSKVNSVKSLIPLPSPSADGVLILNERGPYAASSIVFKGNLTIRGTHGVKAEIHVSNEPLSLVAQSVALEHVTVRNVADADAGSNVLVKIHCQQLELSHCEFFTDPRETVEAQGVASLFWKPFEREAKSGQIAVTNTIFNGNGAAMLLSQSPRELRFANTLKWGQGALVSLGAKSLATNLNLVLDRVTLRDTGPLVRLAGEFASKTGTPPFQIEANNCVFSLAEPSKGFIVLDSERPRSDAKQSVEMRATESVVAPGTTLLTKFDPASNKYREEDADDQFQGLDAKEIQFAGDQRYRASDARTSDLKGPRHAKTTKLPGIDVRSLGVTN